jgi:hypothetical protein
MTTKHTEGPWEVAGGTNKNGDLFVWPVLKPGEMGGHGVAKVCGEYDDQVQANARLIAAAPELLEALRATVDLLEEAHQYESDNGHGGDDGPCPYCDGIDAARAALEKAGAG